MCKHIFQACLGAIVLTATTVTHALSVSSPTIHPMPLEPVEQQGTGVIGFTLTEDHGMDIAFDQDSALPVMVEVALNKLRLDDATPLSGDAAAYFSADFNASNNTVVLSQHAQIPANAELTIQLPVAVTDNAYIKGDYDVGFEASVLSPYEQFAASVEQYTYTNRYDYSVLKLEAPYIAPMPLAPVEEDGKGTAGFVMTVHGDDPIAAVSWGETNVMINATLSPWIELQDGDVSLLSGNMMDYFEAHYVDNRLILLQTVDIPPMSELSIEWPITVVKNSVSGQGEHLFMANFSAGDGNVLALGYASAETYTRAPSIEESIAFAAEHASWKTDLKKNSQALAYTLVNPFDAR